jgi:hypothetical protein|tara:strand:+ start:2272 stop:4437 length:2166 start_codon:yes stop_codon:yes gene_type:complete
MSNDTHDIPIGDETIRVPKWASEATLQTIAELSAVSLQATKELNNIKNDDVSSGEKFQSDLKDIAESYTLNSKETSEKKKKALDAKIVGAAKTIKSKVDGFSETDAPLSSMVRMVDELGSAFMGGSSELAASNSGNNKAAAMISKSLPMVGALGASAMAWVGFQAGQLEQFAKAQETMINSGAIMFDDTSPYENLKQQAINAGLTYTEMSKVVSKNGLGIQSLGTGISDGTTTFLSMLKSVNKTGDDFGDYGLRSSDMAELLSEYIQVQRITLGKDMSLASTQDSVKLSFQELMIETTALASLTGKSRAEIIQSRLAGYADPIVGAALASMVKRGDGSDKVMTALLDDLLLVQPSMGSIGTELVESFAKSMQSSGGDVSRIDIRAQLKPELLKALERANVGFIDNINNVIRTGDIDAAEGGIISKGLIAMQYAQVGNANATDEVAQLVLTLGSLGHKLGLDFNEASKMTSDVLKAHVKKTGDKLDESGSMTVSMNDMKVSFLKVQDAFTLNLKDGTAAAEYLADGLKQGAKKIRKVLGIDESEEDVAALTTNIIDERYANDLKGWDPGKESYDEFMNKKARKRSKNSHNIPGRKFGGPVIKDNTYLVGEEGPELFTPTSTGSITNNDKTKKMLNSKNTDNIKSTELFTPTSHGSITNNDKTKKMLNSKNTDNDMSQHFDDILKTKKQTIMLLKQMKVVMTNIKRSNDYKRTVDSITEHTQY